MLHSETPRSETSSHRESSLRAGLPEHGAPAMHIDRGPTRKLRLFFVVAAVCISHAALAVCPVSQCNYLDPQYKAAYAKYKVASDAWRHCNDAAFDAYFHAMNGLAILYPRFGIAYRAMQSEQKSANAAFDTAETAAGKAARAAADAASAADSAIEAKMTPREILSGEPSKYGIVNPNDAAAAAYAPLDRAAQKEDDRRLKEANQRFTDRILRTAEPDALEFYNLYQLKLKRQIQSCGPAPHMPEPPRN